jgi:acetamidase/formamidase
VAIHEVRPVRAALHGHFSRDLPPILTIDSGDTVRFSTLNSRWIILPPEPHAAREDRLYFEPRDPVLDEGHALCGPIAVRGAEPGMTLAIGIGSIIPGAWGLTAAGGRSTRTNDALGIKEERTLLVWDLSAAEMIGRSQLGHVVRLRPFMGVLGMPPNEPGRHSTTPPRVWGGNIDCRELIAGSTLYLPIPVTGALFSVGDGHGLQGDGEVSGTAIECPMEQVELTFTVMPELSLAEPRAQTPAGWVTFGFDASLDVASIQALDGMLRLLGELFGLARIEALALASVIVDLRVTQIANRVHGVHALLPHGSLLDLPATRMGGIGRF